MTETTTETTDTVPTTGSDNFLDVSYSLDGTTWQDLGQVNASNWQNFSVTIPVNSWSDIDNLQIQLNPLPSADAPTISLDSMWLGIDYNQSLAGALQAGASAALDAVSSLSDAVNGAVDAAANALSNLLPANTTAITPQAAPTSPPPPPPPPPPVHHYVFTVGTTMPTDVANLAWISSRYATAYASYVAGHAKSPLPVVKLSDPNSIEVSGECAENFYTILLFANPTDYQTDPSLALLNQAHPCVGGTFDQMISDNIFPPSLASGTYYLMVADQGTRGPWEPHPALYPIILDNTIVAATSSQ